MKVAELVAAFGTKLNVSMTRLDNLDLDNLVKQRLNNEHIVPDEEEAEAPVLPQSTMEGEAPVLPQSIMEGEAPVLPQSIEKAEVPVLRQSIEEAEATVLPKPLEEHLVNIR
jgi:hypothetical protein